MLGQSKGHISNHRGLGCKQKQGFLARKAHQQRLLNKQAAVPRHGPHRERGRSGRHDIAWTVFRSVVLLVGLFFLAQPIRQVLVDYQNEIVLNNKLYQTRQAAERQQAWDMIIALGNGHLQRGEWYLAQEIFQSALRQAPYDLSANFGLTQSLVYQCHHFNDNCGMAYEYLDFYARLSADNAVKLKELEKLLD